MTKKEFFDLVDKYNQGSFTAAERRTLETFCDQVQLAEISAQWNLMEEEVIRIRLLKRILKSVDRFEIEQTQSRRRWMGTVWRVAASVALIVGISWYWVYQSATPQVHYITKTAHRGERDSVLLSDGSLIRLNAETTVSYPETLAALDTREIELSGEAFFEVAHNPKKPFIVKTGDLHTTVLGTSFNIQAYPKTSDVTITVATGKVQVVPVQQAAKAILTPGQQAVYNRQTRAITQAEVTLDKYLAWKDGIIVLDRLTMGEAADMLGRWYNAEFVFENEKIRDCVINGEFKDDGLDGILENVKFLTNIEYQILAGNRVVIRGQACH